MPAADGMNRQGLSFLAVLPQRGNENRSGIQLMAAQFGHQSAPRPLEQPPATEFFQRRAFVIAIFLVQVAEVFGLDRLVGVPGGPLRDLPRQFFACLGIFGSLEIRLEPLQLIFDAIHHPAGADNFFAAGQWLLPTVAARQIPAMPLGANVVDFAEQSPAQQVDGVVVENVVVPLMPHGQQHVLGLGHARHDFALRDVVGHQFLGQHVLA
jgi:hypothetical protein